MRTRFFSSGACVTVIEGNAVFIEEAMVIGLFKSVPLAEFIVVAGPNAVLKIGQFVGVNKVPSAFVRSMALPCRTSERNFGRVGEDALKMYLMYRYRYLRAVSSVSLDTLYTDNINKKWLKLYLRYSNKYKLPVFSISFAIVSKILPLPQFWNKMKIMYCVTSHSQSLSTDAVWADSSIWMSRLCAVGKEHAQVLCWLPGPPLAVLIFPTNPVAGFSILQSFEIDRIFLKKFIYQEEL